MHRLRMPLALAATATLIASCGMREPAKSTPTPPIRSTKTPTSTSETNNPLCASLAIVHASRLDTDGTKQQVAANNRVIASVCGQGR